MSKLMKILTVRAELFHAYRRTDMTVPIDTFHNFADAPQKCDSGVGCAGSTCVMQQHQQYVTLKPGLYVQKKQEYESIL